MNQKVHFSSFLDNRKEIEYTIQSTIYVYNYVCVCVCVLPSIIIFVITSCK